MKEKKINLKEALNNQDDFLSFLEQEACSDEYRKLKQKAEKETHPRELLHDYVLGWLDNESTQKIKAHISLCEKCAKEVLRIRLAEEELEREMLEWADTPTLIQRIRQFFLAPKSEWFLSPKIITSMAAACLVFILVIYGLYERNSVIPETSIPVYIALIGNPAVSERIKGKTDSLEEFELKEGGILKSGEYFRVKVSPERPAYLYILLYDSSGEITPLFADKAGTDVPILLPDKENAFQLDEHKGTETIYVLASEEEIEDFNKKIKMLKRTEVNEIEKVFPKISIRTFVFKHE